MEDILSKISVSQAAKLCDVSERTIRDWRRGKFLIQKMAMIKLYKKTCMPAPIFFEEKEDYWYASKGAKIGGKLGAAACIEKYGFAGGDPVYRKKKWYQWWNNKGKYAKNSIIKAPLKIKKPRFSKDLAEFTGIMLGDGGIAISQIVISTNSIDDKQYSFFVKELIKKLFGVEAAMYYPPCASVVNIVVSRKNLVEFCNKKLGLKIGHKLKQGLDIPPWIKGNLEFEKACMRGLMDTDGCLFHECHNIKGKKYCYPRLSFVTASVPLRNSVVEILQKLNLNPKIRGSNQRYVQIEDKEKIREYFRVVGSSNPKHLNKYYN